MLAKWLFSLLTVLSLVAWPIYARTAQSSFVFAGNSTSSTPTNSTASNSAAVSPPDENTVILYSVGFIAVIMVGAAVAWFTRPKGSNR